MSRKRPRNKRVPINSVRTAFLTNYYNFYRFDKIWTCTHCNTDNAWFKSLEVEPDLVKFNFECNSCRAQFDMRLDYKRFKKLHINYSNTIDRTNITKWGEVYRIWLTAQDYPEFLKDEDSEKSYFDIMERLRVGCQGRMKFWNMAKKMWDAVL